MGDIATLMQQQVREVAAALVARQEAWIAAAVDHEGALPTLVQQDIEDGTRYLLLPTGAPVPAQLAEVERPDMSVLPPCGDPFLLVLTLRHEDLRTVIEWDLLGGRPRLNERGILVAA